MKVIDFIQQELCDIKNSNNSYYEIDVDKEYIKNMENVYKCVKAINIIKEKKVFVANLIYHFETDDNVINYNRTCGWAKSELTQEEYDLLKGVLYEKEN